MRGYVYTCLLPGAPNFKAGRCSHISNTIRRYKGAFGPTRIRFFAVDDDVLAERLLFKELHDRGFSDGRFGEVYQCSSGKGLLNDIVIYTERHLTGLYGTPEAHNINCKDRALLATYEHAEEVETTDSTKCARCLHTFSTKKELNRHKCRGVHVRTCPDCLKTFNNPQAKYDHRRRGQCHPAPEQTSSVTSVTINNTTINGNVDSLQGNVDNRQAIVDSLQGNVDNHQTNVTINYFGEDSINHILDDKRRMDCYIERSYMGIADLIRDFYFDPERPDNHSVRMPNCRDKFVEVLTQKGWQTRIKKEVVDEMIQRYGDTLEQHFDRDATQTSWMRKHFSDIIKACVETPYDKEKRTALENEIMIVIKDGRKTCVGKPSCLAAEASQDIRHRLLEQQMMIDELRKSIDLLAKR